MSAEADLLRRAAALVRERGKAARARGPFFVEGRCFCHDDEEYEDRCDHRDSSWRLRTEVPHDDTILSYQVAVVDDEDDARWLALVGPPAADPLAEWLDYAAGIAEWSPTIPMLTAPLALARALLGETEETTP